MAEDQPNKGIARRPLWRLGIILAVLPVFSVIRGELDHPIFPFLLIGCAFGVALLAGLVLTRASPEEQAAAKAAEGAQKIQPVRSRVGEGVIAACGVAVAAICAPSLFSDSPRLLVLIFLAGIGAAVYGIWSFIVGPRQQAEGEKSEDK